MSLEPCERADEEGDGVRAEGALGIMVFLPRHTDLAQLSAALPPGACCEVERIVLNGFFKAITVYIGPVAEI